jgi:hypothetical protein
MPVTATHVIAWTLPTQEIVVAVALVLNWFAAKLAALVLLSVFCAIAAIVLSKRLKVPCGCFEGLGQRYLSTATLRDNALLALAVVAALPLQERAQVVFTLPAAGFALLFTLIVRELWGQYRLVRGLREQGVL